jgi:hypothetical protein
MKKRSPAGHPLACPAACMPAGESLTGAAFRTEWIDFERGIRVGHLEPHERITRILKSCLEERHRTPFVTDRWGRGVFWQWICWLPRANRTAKPLSNKVNFGCAKLFISADRDLRVFKAGLQVERGFIAGPEAARDWGLRDDWDWHRLVRQCRKGSTLDRELCRLLHEDEFAAEVGDWEDNAVFTASNFRSAGQLANVVRKCPPRRWAGFQLYHPMPEAELRTCSGHELVEAVCSVFLAVVPAMNCCMQVPLSCGR